MFVLVDGDRQAVIVSGAGGGELTAGWNYYGDGWVPEGPLVHTGVGGGENLQKYIEMSAGRKLRVVDEKDYAASTMPLAIFVGDTEKARELFSKKLKNMDTDGYIVHVTPSFVVLAGNVEYAEFDFLRTYMGIDNYIPTKLFTIVPKHKTVKVPVGTRIELPAFFSRAFSGLHTDEGVSGRSVIPWRIHPGHGRYKFHHNINKIISSKEFGKDHPEYFALINGKRHPSNSNSPPNPCTSNPDVVQIAIEKSCKIFNEHPGAESVSLGMTDAWAFCKCHKCKALDSSSIKVGGKRSSMSGRYYTFLNHVAKDVHKTHPGKYIGTIAYSRAERPPRFPVERNILPYICDSSAEWGNAEEKDADMGMLNAWLERVDSIGIYEYLYGKGFFVPRLYTRHLAEKLRHVKENSLHPGFYAEIYSSHGFDGPKAWITEKLLWNPWDDIDKLLTQWTIACFGPAAEPMKQYFDLLEETWSRNSAIVKPSGLLWGYKTENQFDMFTPDDLEPLWKLLENARARAAKHETLLQRIEYFASAFKITDVLTKRHHAHAEGVRLMEKGSGVPDVLASMLKNEHMWPRFDLWRYVEETRAGDWPRIYSGPASSRATLLMEYILENSS